MNDIAYMSDVSAVQKIIITCLPGLEGTVEMELKQLGFKVIDSRPKAVTTEGNIADTYKMNLWLRSASNVLYRIAAFKCSHPDHLYKTAVKIPWASFMTHKEYFTVNSFVVNKFINDTRFANLRLKDAIVDYFYKKFDKRPDSGSHRDGVSYFLHWINNDAAIYIDTTGKPLTRRGYRVETGPAPLNEALAAALVLNTSWDKKSPFINPMCGTGTLAIEAALIAYNIAPGLLRDDFSFFHLRDFNKEQWSQLFNEAKNGVYQEGPTMVGTDKSRRIIRSSIKNATKAGVANFIEFYPGDFEKTRIPEGEEGVVIFNPEYGQRLGDVTELERTYARIGDFLKQSCVGYTGYVFTGNLDLAKHVGLRSDQRITFFNARIECRLLEYNLYDGSKKSKINNEEEDN